MFKNKKIRVDAVLYDRATQQAKKLGYTSVDELVAHLLNNELRALDEQANKQKVLEKMRGLGYVQ